MAFYVVSDRRHFPGLVALINSIRLVGHDEPIFVVDGGLEDAQRELLSRETTVVPAPSGVPLVFLRPVAPLLHPAGVEILLDADVIVVRRLTALIDMARDGRLVAFSDNDSHRDRFFREWESALGLSPLRRQPYCNAGQMLIPGELGDRLLRTWQDCLAKIDVDRTWHANGALSDPFYFGDQDVLNAIAASVLGLDEMVTMENRLAPHPPFAGLELVDPDSLACRYSDGVQPFVLHHTLAKPWLRATRRTVYSDLLSRLLLASDVRLRLGPDQLPLRLRNGPLAAADGFRAHTQAVVTTHARRQLGRFGIRTRAAAWRRSRRLRRR